MKFRSKSLLASALLSAVCTAAIAEPASSASTASAHAAVPPWGVDLGDMNKDVKPGDDFFLYANGTWVKTSVIAPDRSYNGVNYELNKQNEERLKSIVAELQSRDPATLSAEEKKLRAFYGAFADEKRIEAQGLAPAQSDLNRIVHLKTEADVARLMADPALQLDGPFGIYIGVNDKNPNAYSVNFYQSGLGMPDRDYYLRKNKELEATRAAYRKYLTTVLQLAGASNPDKRAAAIYTLEVKIAQAHWPAAERRDADKTYNPLTISALEKYAPEFPWRAYLSGTSVGEKFENGADRTLIVAEKSAFPTLAKIFAETPLPVWRDYLTVRYLHSFAAYLPKKFDDTDFAFYGTILQGKPQQLDRATRGVQLLDNAMGEALGKLYVAKYFPPEAKAKAQLLVANLLKAYEADIKTLDWMTPATREKALEKLHHYMLKIGYPDHWRDYSALQVGATSLIQDVKNASAFEWTRRVRRIDQPVDKAEWGMTPPTNNAYYNPTFNEIVFPAGILQPPFFDPNADDAVNYGGIGATIGHEISHGFDDQGSKYDANGVLRNWWTEADRKNFDARTAALAKQYDHYEPLPGIHINGKSAPVLDGYTGDQRFYISYSQSWREKYRDGLLRERLLSNPHSPPAYRVNGVVRNDDGWYAAFSDIKSGNKYYLSPDQRVRLW